MDNFTRLLLIAVTLLALVQGDLLVVRHAASNSNTLSVLDFTHPKGYTSVKPEDRPYLTRIYGRELLAAAIDPDNPLRLDDGERRSLLEAFGMLDAAAYRLLWEGHRLLEQIDQADLDMYHTLLKDRLSHNNIIRTQWMHVTDQLTQTFAPFSAQKASKSEMKEGWSPRGDPLHPVWREVFTIRYGFPQDAMLEVHHRALVFAVIVNQKKQPSRRRHAELVYTYCTDIVDAAMRLRITWEMIQALALGLGDRAAPLAGFISGEERRGEGDAPLDEIATEIHQLVQQARDATAPARQTTTASSPAAPR